MKFLPPVYFYSWISSQSRLRGTSWSSIKAKSCTKNNPMQQYILGANLLKSGDQLTYKIAQAGTFFLEVHSGRTRGGRHSIKPGKFLLNYREKDFYYERGQMLEQVPRAAVESPAWKHARPIWTQPWTTFSTWAFSEQGVGLEDSPFQSEWFCISNLQLKDTLSPRQF